MKKLSRIAVALAFASLAAHAHAGAGPETAVDPNQAAQVQLSAELATAWKETEQLRTQLAAAEKARDEAIAAAKTPAYPDLREKVASLENQLADAKKSAATPAAPTAPDASTTPANADEVTALREKLADTEDRLATALRGYSLIEQDRAPLKEKLADTEKARDDAQAEVARLTKALEAATPANDELAKTRDLLREVQGSNSLLAQENYRLKAALSPAPIGGSTNTQNASARTYTVQAGDTLSKISTTLYGKPDRWRDLYAANRELLADGTLRVGMALRLP